jgi:hypothetical protein
MATIQKLMDVPLSEVPEHVRNTAEILSGKREDLFQNLSSLKDQFRFEKDAGLFRSYYPECQVFGYLQLPEELGDNQHHQGSWYVMHDGTAVSPVWGGKHHGEIVGWLHYGCEHNYRELSVAEAREKGHNHFGMCYHVCECQKCGHINAYDSSG